MIIVQNIRLLLYKIEDDYCTKYKIIIVKDTRKLLYEMQENYCTRYYKIIIVQYIRLLLYKIQEFYCIRYKYCTRYNIITVHDTCCMKKTAQNGSIDFTTHQENQMVVAQCYD